jgi:glycoprotein endo-alpha-1,2-mannosidase
MKPKIKLTFLIALCLVFNINAQNKHSKLSKFPSYKGLVMAGYQGWFNCEGDGANRGWTHYAKGKKFEDGSCTIDFWPEMSEYKKQYKTPFTFEDGSAAFVFSSYDESTVDLHFKWMKEYRIDGVFMQRFFEVLENPNRRKHADKVLTSALKAANKYGIAICLMYDIGSMDDSKYNLVKEDWKHLVDDLKLTSQGKKTNYLFHNNKPLVALWGISAGTRQSGHIPEIFDIMDFLKNDPDYGGCSIQLGVPSRWRTLGSDTKGDPRLLEAIGQADIVHPWFVGRYNEANYEDFRKEVIVDDVKWCKEHGKSYVPTVYPGFSWYNMKSNAISNKTPRNKGQFYWKQIAGAITSGAEMLYVAMFDEIDEGTAIMKCAHKVPVGKSVFVPIEKEVPTDHYLWLTNQAAKMLRGETPFSNAVPKRE